MTTVVYRGDKNHLLNHHDKGAVRVIRVERGYERDDAGYNLFTSAVTFIGYSDYIPSFISKLSFDLDWCRHIAERMQRFPLIEKLKIITSDRCNKSGIAGVIEQSETLRSVSCCSMDILAAAARNKWITKIKIPALIRGNSTIPEFINIKSLRIGSWLHPEGSLLLDLASRGVLEKLAIPNIQIEILFKLIALPNLKYVSLRRKPDGYKECKAEIQQHINDGGIIVLRTGRRVFESLRSISIFTRPLVFDDRHMSLADIRIICWAT